MLASPPLPITTPLGLYIIVLCWLVRCKKMAKLGVYIRLSPVCLLSRPGENRKEGVLLHT